LLNIAAPYVTNVFDKDVLPSTLRFDDTVTEVANDAFDFETTRLEENVALPLTQRLEDTDMSPDVFTVNASVKEPSALATLRLRDEGSCAPPVNILIVPLPNCPNP